MQTCFSTSKTFNICVEILLSITSNCSILINLMTHLVGLAMFDILWGLVF
jgi:hypothetical protein